MEKLKSAQFKLSHKQFRALLKKFRRKKIRQKLAKEREQQEILEQQKKENTYEYKELQEDIRRNSELYDQFEERERIREHKLWLWREQKAQEEFKRKQERLEQERIKREEERKRIIEEFEKQEYVEKQAEEEVIKIKSQKEEALQAALSNLSEDGPWHNPIAPENYNAGKEREKCLFFAKTGCCRFGERCSRGHSRPDVSCTILIKGMYSHFSIDQTAREDFDSDIALEYEDKECYDDFRNFYNDVLPEFKKFGKVVQFKVCNNFEPHLRGNVYVQYTREQDAIEAYKNFNGRYYAGKQITCEFTNVIRWRSAICGLFSRSLCPKGVNCNFLHVFKNPNDEFWEANRDLRPRESHHHSDPHRKRRDDSRDFRYRHESKSRKYESRSDRRESKSDRYESKSDRHESRSDRHESRSDRHESRSDYYEPRSERYNYKNNRYDSRNDKYEPTERYDSRSSRHDSKSNYHSESDSSEKDSELSHSKQSMNGEDFDFKHKKRSRDSSSESRSNSPFEERSHKKRSRKKKNRKKKKSKSSNKQEFSANNSSESGAD